MRNIALGAALAAGLITAAHAQNSTFQNPCHSPPYTDFDFWVGEWVAFDYDTGVVEGIDMVTREINGCVLMQDWIQLTDTFRYENQPDRFEGLSFNSLTMDGQWQQVWDGNTGGTITLVGGLDDEGRMVLTTALLHAEPQGFDYRRTFTWEPQDDGTLHVWGEIQIRNEDGTWRDPVIEWNLRQVRRTDVGPLIEAP